MTPDSWVSAGNTVQRDVRFSMNFSSGPSVLTPGEKRSAGPMNPLLIVCLSAGTPFAGYALMRLQARLERWDYERHAND
jgi:hypothetical protein